MAVRTAGCFLLFACSFLLGACTNRYQSTLTALVVGGQTPMNEVEQIYYLGVFDPRSQVPPQVYRIRVHGQSSLGNAKFSSGWVPASLIDTLSLPKSNEEQAGIDTAGRGSPFLDGRNLIAFGPEGFREVPQDYRLVMTMGNDAGAFFEAVGVTLGTVANAELRVRNVEVNSELFKALSDLLREKQRHVDLTPDPGASS
ncbi:MAG: hypothetical protein IPK97_01450 [Ahniella sp.]|nr:hypothetical protein [Ahniella sp.]